MPAKKNSGGGNNVAEIEKKLRPGFFIMRRDVREAFGLSEEEMTTLVSTKVFRAEYPVKGGRARFVRSKVLAVAKKWEAINL